MDYMVFVFFVYGLSFFSLGVTILIYPRKDSKYEIAGDLWLIGAFGLTHGINEWIDMSLLLMGEGEITSILRLVRFVILPVSFFFLLIFGVKVVSKMKKSSHIGLVSLVFLIWGLLTALNENPFQIGGILARYLIGVPGIFLTAYGLYLQLPEFRDDLPKVAINLKLASLAFALYGVFSGMMVPSAGFFPASVFNYDLFLGIFGIPVQVFRTACAAGIAYHTFRVMRIFEWETTDALRKARDELEVRVQERTSELKDAYDRHESYIFSVADGLRNPLQVFLGNIDLIDTAGLTHEQKNAIERASESAELLRENILFLTDRESIDKAERAIKESEDKYSSLFNQSADSVFLLEPPGKKGLIIIDVNASACTLHGYTRDELLGKPISILDHPQTREHVPERTERLMAGEEIVFEGNHIRKDGTSFPVEVTARLIHIRSKPYILAIDRDITVQRQARRIMEKHNTELQAALEEMEAQNEELTHVHIELIKAEDTMKESKEKFEAIFNNTMDGILVADTEEKKFLMGNETICKMLGYTTEEIGELGVMDIHPKSALLHVIKQFEKQQKREIKIAHDLPVLRKDGTIFYADISSAPMVLGGKTYMIGIFRDITESKVAEERFRRVYETSNVGIVITDSEGRFTQSNLAFQEMVGYSAKELDMEFKDITHPDDMEKNMERFRDLVDGKKDHYEIEKRYIKKDGSIMWTNMEASAVRDPAGTFLYSFGMIVDITDRKETQREILAYAEKLDESNRLKELFIDTLHHDLMNPLQVMIMYLDLLSDIDELSPEDHLKYTSIIEDNVKRSIDLLEDASTYAGIESPGDITFETLDVGSILRSSINGVKPLLGDRIIETKLEGEFVLSGNNMLSEVFINLISNAVKYSPVGEPIEVGITDEGDALKVYVKDQGDGVSDVDKEIIFQRLERGTRKGIKGSGLGLAIAKRIVQIHNGKIWVEDNYPTGSIFYVQLPKERDQ